MNRRCFFTLLMLPALAVCGLAFGQAPQANRSKAELDKIKQAIQKNGKLPSASYWHNAEVLRGAKKRTIAAVPMKAGKAVAPTSGSKSAFTIVGGEGLPPGFGSGFTWDRIDEEALLVIFIRAYSVKMKNYSPLPIEMAATYWHFVDVLWIYLFIFYNWIG